MRLHRVGAIVLRQFYLYRGSPARVVPLFAWVGIDIVLWGFITRYLNRVSGSGFDFVPALLGAVLLWDFSIRVMQGVSMAFLEEVWSRNFLNLFATPLRLPEYLGGLVLSSIATTSIGLAVMLAVATAVFGLAILATGMALIGFLLVLFLFGIALGITASAIVLRLGPASEWFIWPIPALISPFAGVFYPLSTLPPWMQVFSHILPPAYVFEGLRGIVAGRATSAGGLAVGATLAVLYVIVACWLFARIYRYAVRTGLIGRYSAETVS